MTLVAAEAAELHDVAQLALSKSRGIDLDALQRAGRAQDRWVPRWAHSLAQSWSSEAHDLNALQAAAEAAWERHVGKARRGPARLLRKADDEPTAAEIAALAAAAELARPDLMPELEAELAERSATGFATVAEPVYQTLAADTAEDAGQHGLDQLGLNRTFRWTSVRDMPRDIFQVRGSKVIQHAHGEHVDQLRKIIVRATNPAAPSTQSDTRRRIREEWIGLTARQVETIARTETAAVWETMNLNTYRANGVEQFDVVIAHGPSIGPPRSEEVCSRCLRVRAGGPYGPDNVPVLPVHPNCRCTIVPRLADDWLPPAEPWDGGPYPALPLVPAHTP